MSEIVLYQYGGSPEIPSFSPPCLKVHLALRRLGLQHRVVDLPSPLAVKRHSPTGRVPALTLGGATIADSVFILDRLEQLHPDGAAWPKDPDERNLDRLWDCFVTDTLYWQGFYLRWLVPNNREEVLDMAFGPGLSFRRTVMRLVGLPLLRSRARGQGIGGRSPEDVAASFARSLSMIEAGLGAGPFLQSRAEPGRGDLAVAAHVAQLLLPLTGPRAGWLEAKHPRLHAHVRATFEACGLQAP